MSELSPQSTALIIIDMQLAIDHFDAGGRSHPEAESKAAELLSRWRERSGLIIHIRHSSKNSESPYHASSPYYDFNPLVSPLNDELVLTKQENCAFVGTQLESQLRDWNVRSLLICGVLINHSVDVTARMASALGFEVSLVEDATAAFPMTVGEKSFSAEEVHGIFLNNLAGEYVSPVMTKNVMSLAL